MLTKALMAIEPNKRSGCVAYEYGATQHIPSTLSSSNQMDVAVRCSLFFVTFISDESNKKKSLAGVVNWLKILKRNGFYFIKSYMEKYIIERDRGKVCVRERKITTKSFGY